MAKSKLAGPGKAGNLKGVKKNLKKGGNHIISSVPKDGSVVVRFLTEPEEWYGYHEVFDEDLKTFYPLLSGMSTGLKGEKPTFRYLAAVCIVESDYDQDIGKVVPFRLPKTLANSLIIKYEKFDTVMDRDYDLTRSGDGFDTVYDATPESKSDFNFKKHLKKVPDPEETLLKVYAEAWGDEDEDDDEPEEDTVSRKRPGSGPSKKSKKRPPVDVDDEDDDEDDEPVKPVKKKAKKKPVSTSAPARRRRR